MVKNNNTYTPLAYTKEFLFISCGNKRDILLNLDGINSFIFHFQKSYVLRSRIIYI